tara:strand:- start:44 stop:679 length:636 start_codon:yes stop_codon:yes gene_type:complete
MSCILYYSNFCENSKKILQKIAKSNIKNDLHFICIDKRIQKNNKTYIILESNQEILLPDNINAVPALLLLNKNYQVIFGEEILTYLNPIENNIVQVKDETHKINNNQMPKINNNYNNNNNNNNNNYIQDEPSAYMLNNNLTNVVSDNFSFLDQNSDELSTKGHGGLRQLYRYSTIDSVDSITTPEEDYKPDKIGEVNIKDIENQRNIMPNY